MEQVVVSIVMPVYNAAAFLGRAIDSLLNQTYPSFELILVNDGSTDKSQEIINSYEDERIVALVQDNQGPSAARNLGMYKARGEFLVFVDADDYALPNYVEGLVSQALKGFDVVACGYVEVSDYGRTSLNDFYQGKNELTLDEFVLGIVNGVGGTLWGKIYRREVIISHQLSLNPKIYMCEDLLFNLEYCQFVTSFAAIDANLYEYNRLNEQSITSKVTFKYLENNLDVAMEMKKLLAVLGWESRKIEQLIMNRLSSLTISIAENESKQVFKVGVKRSFQNIELLLNHHVISHYFSGYTPSSSRLDCGSRLLHQSKIKRSMVCFFGVSKLREVNRWIKKWGRV